VAVTVRRGLWRELRARETVLLYVRSVAPDRLRTALPSAVAEIAAVDAGWQPVPGLAPGDQLTVGDPEQWIPGHPDQEAVRDRARRLLEPAT
jgi:hypothetical protein